MVQEARNIQHAAQVSQHNQHSAKVMAKERGTRAPGTCQWRLGVKDTAGYLQ